MTTFLSILAIAYLAASFCLAVARISKRWKYEDYMETVPMGDTALHSPKTPLFDLSTIVFFPASLIILAWISAANLVNSRLL